ncbi:uncharacterized protein isoform X2 [Rhodnius prolixus]
MVDITNDFGICVLQLVYSRRENIAFSPYGLLSVALVMYEGASGPTAAEIHNTLRLPWNRDITRVGFRDMHRYLKSYFSNDGFLRGLVLSKPNVVLHWNYSRLLQFYGFDMNMEVEAPNYGSTPTTGRPVLQDVPASTRPTLTSTTLLPSTTPTPPPTTIKTTVTTTIKPETTETPTVITEPIPTIVTTESTLPAAARTDEAITTTVSILTTLETTATTSEITTVPVTTTTPPETTTATPETTTAVPVTTTTTPETTTTVPVTTTTTVQPIISTSIVTTTEIPSNDQQEITSAVQNGEADTAIPESADLIQLITTTKSPSTEAMEGKEFEAIVEQPITTEKSKQTMNNSTEIYSSITQAGTTDELTFVPSASEGLDVTTSNTLSTLADEFNAQPSSFNLVRTTLERIDLTSIDPSKEMPNETESLSLNYEITEQNLENQSKIDTTMSTDHTEISPKEQNVVTEESSSTTTVSENQSMVSTAQPNPTETPVTTEIFPNSEFEEISTQNPIINSGSSAEPIVLDPDVTAESSATFSISTLSSNAVSENAESTSNSIFESEGTYKFDSSTLSGLFESSSATNATVENDSLDSNISAADKTSVGEEMEISVSMLDESEVTTVFNSFTSDILHTVSNENNAFNSSNETETILSSESTVKEYQNSSEFNVTYDSEVTTITDYEVSKDGEEIDGDSVTNILSINSSILNDTGEVTSEGKENKATTIASFKEDTEEVTFNSNTSFDNLSSDSESVSMDLSTTLNLTELPSSQSETTTQSFKPSVSNIEISTKQDQNSDNAINSTKTPKTKKRKKRSFGHGFEHREGPSNWVPHYQDIRWSYQSSNEHWFFTMDGGENVPVLSYTAFLPFAYIPEISSLALQLPLDDPRYSILIVLPQERQGLVRMLYSLQWCSVKAIKHNLKITAVYAVLPTFTIVKHINLVPALAQLGIVSLFDPFKADLSAMSPEPNLYVRTIEQVVTVSVRKYYTSQRWYDTAPTEIEQHFIANHPFAYFVIDKETEVVLMAGTIVNPLAHNQQL